MDEENLAIVDLVHRVQELLSTAEAGENPRTVVLLDRARRQAGALAAIVDSADLTLVPPSASEAVEPHLASAIGLLESLGGDSDADQVLAEEAGTQLGHAMTAASALLVTAPIIAPDGQREAAAAYRRAVGQFLHLISEERDSAAAKLAEIQEAGEEIRTAQQSNAASAAAELEKLEADIATNEDRMGALATRLQTDFLAAQEARQKAAQDAAAEVEAAAEVQRADLDAKAAEALEALVRHRDEAARLVNAVGQNAFAGGFGEYANGEGRAANFWRWVTVGSLLAIAAVGVWYLYSVGQTEFSLQAFWIRAVILLPVAFVAAYAARQSGRHRRNEVRSRSVALELLALDPYLELLPDELRQPVKVKMADRFFGNSPADLTEDSVGITEALETIAKHLRR